MIDREGQRTRIAADSGGVVVNGGPAAPVWRSAPGGWSTVLGKRFRGAIEVRRAKQGLMVINTVPLEVYVAGAVAGEVPASWKREALRAQAVASRTYALHERAAHGRGLYHVEASTKSQVYAGGATAAASIRGAVRDTRCEILTDGGVPILAAFHSASGGRTASSKEVWGRGLRYLVSRQVVGEDDSPDTYWRVAVTRTTLGRALAAAGHRIGEVRRVEVLSRSESGRVTRVQIEGAGGDITLTGRELRSAIGDTTLRSTLFEIRTNDEGFVFVGTGSGHGVGMSQWGALALAERGMGYREILEKFYPGAKLERIQVRRAGPPRSGDSLGGTTDREGESVANRMGEQR